MTTDGQIFQAALDAEPNRVCHDSRNKAGPFSVYRARRKERQLQAERHPGTSTVRYRHAIAEELSRRTVAALAACFGLWVGISSQGAAAADQKDIAQALRAGGPVIVVCHGATFPDQADTDPLNFDNIAAQRNLNDKGKALAKAFGDAFRELGVPVGVVYTSKYNRAYETAVLAGFKNIQKTTDLTEGGLIVSPNENARRAEAFRKMLGTTPKPGTNTILISINQTSLRRSGRTGST